MTRLHVPRVLAFVAALVLLPFADAAAQAGAKAAGDPKGLVPPPKAWAAQVSPSEFTLVWQRVPSATGYEVLVRNAQGHLTRLGLLTASGSRYIVPLARLSAMGIVLDQLHFAVRALNGALEGPLTMFNTVQPAKQSAAKALVAPGRVTASETAPGIITVTWDEVDGATAYAIGRAVGTSGFQRFCDICPTGGILVDTVPTAGTRYVYNVTALTPSGRSRGISTQPVVVTGLATDDGGAVVTGSGPRLDPKSLAEGAMVSARPVGPDLVQVLVSFAAQRGGIAGELVRRLCTGAEQVISRFDSLVPIDIQDRIGGTNVEQCNAVEKQRVQYFVRIRDAKGLASQSKMATADLPAVTVADTTTGAALDPKGLAAGVTVTPRYAGNGALGAIIEIAVTLANRAGLGQQVTMATQLMRKVCDGPWTVVRAFPLGAGVVNLQDVVGGIDQQCDALGPAIQYQVRISDAKGLAADSKAAVVVIPTVEPVAAEPPATPGNRRLATTSDGRRTLMWDAVAGATSYRIERIAGAKGAWTVVQELPGSATTWVDTAKVEGTPQYRITAVNRAGNSATGAFR